MSFELGWNGIKIPISVDADKAVSELIRKKITDIIHNDVELKTIVEKAIATQTYKIREYIRSIVNEETKKFLEKEVGYYRIKLEKMETDVDDV